MSHLILLQYGETLFRPDVKISAKCQVSDQNKVMQETILTSSKEDLDGVYQTTMT